MQPYLLYITPRQSISFIFWRLMKESNFRMRINPLC
nr:MAG TPA: hypothetical protein [Caudoviricetes sp.]